MATVTFRKSSGQGDQQRHRLPFRNAAGTKIKKQLLIKFARSGAMAANNIIRENFKLGLGVELRRFGKQQSLRHLLAICLLRVRSNFDLALENTARFFIHY